MASFQGNQSTAGGPLGASGTGAKPSAVGQVAMATDHGGRRSAPTDVSGQSRGGGTWRAEGNGGKKASSGPDASTGRERAREEGNAPPYGMRNVQSDWRSKYCLMYCDMQHCAVLRRGEWTWQFRWSIPTPGDENRCGKPVSDGLRDKNCKKCLFWYLGGGLCTLQCWIVL